MTERRAVPRMELLAVFVVYSRSAEILYSAADSHKNRHSEQICHLAGV